jgi:DNA-binding transcriptional MerR regulator
MPRHDLPEKIYFKIGEVSDILGLPPHVLRYWESEFEVIRPTKSKSGQRLYRRRDVEIIALIKDLLHRQKFTIKGARQHLKVKGIGKALEEKAERDERDPSLFLEDVSERLSELSERTQRLIGDLSGE